MPPERIAISHEDIKNMTLAELNNQKIFYNERGIYLKKADFDYDEIEKINIDNINTEINTRYTRYALIAGVGVIVGMYALRKFKK
tara:strand:- start:732 stop:986 length:255 start_codon:yes stop_codon:yes gene_type:complete